MYVLVVLPGSGVRILDVFSWARCVNSSRIFGGQVYRFQTYFRGPCVYVIVVFSGVGCADSSRIFGGRGSDSSRILGGQACRF